VTFCLIQTPFNLVGVMTIGDDIAPSFFYLEEVSITQGSSVYNVRVQNVDDLAIDTDYQYQVQWQSYKKCWKQYKHLRYDHPNGLNRIHICVFYQKNKQVFFIKM